VDEIKALEQISEIMLRFDSKTQRRMIWWLNARLVQRIEKDILERAQSSATSNAA